MFIEIRHRKIKGNFMRPFKVLSKSLYIVCILTLICLTMVSCGKRETVLRIALADMPASFDPILAREFTIAHINRNIFETLVVLEGENIVPGIAEYWFLASDNVLTVQIKDGIYFSDNTPLTVYDVLLSLNRALYHPRSVLSRFIQIDSVYVTENNQINLVISSSDNNNVDSANTILYFLNNVPIYSANHLENHDDEFLSTNPLGTGPYYLYEHSAEMITLRRNEFHRDFRRNSGNPDIVRIIREPCFEKQFQMFKDNKVDLILQLPVSLYHEVFKSDEYQSISFVSNNVIFLMLDTVSSFSPFIDRPENPLRDIRVRRAIAHALDIDTYIDTKLYGNANRLVIPVIRELRGYPTHLNYYQYDLELSRELMELAGLSDGFTMRLKTLDGQFSSDLSILVKNSLAQININVIIDTYEAEEFLRTLETTQPASFIFAMSASPDTDDIIRAVTSLFPRGSNIPRNRFTKMNNVHPRMNYILEELRVMKTYDISRQDLFNELTEIIHYETNIIPFFQPYNFYLLNKRFAYERSSILRLTDFTVRR